MVYWIISLNSANTDHNYFRTTYVTCGFCTQKPVFPTYYSELNFDFGPFCVLWIVIRNTLKEVFWLLSRKKKKFFCSLDFKKCLYLNGVRQT